MRSLSSRISRIPRPLAVLLVLALVQSLAWIAIVPAFQGPDEPAHFGYTQNLAENHARPKFDQGSGTDSTEVGNALTFLNLRALAGSPDARPPFSAPDLRAWRNLENSLPDAAKKDAGGPNAVAKNPPLYYLYEAVPYLVFRSAPLLDRVFVMRLANALLFIGTVLFAYLLATELFARVWLRVLVASLVLLQPMLAFMASVVNPDTLQACLWTAFAWISVRTLGRGSSARRLALMGALVVAVVLTHGRGVAIVPPAVVAVLLIAQRHRPRWRKPVLLSMAAVVPLAVIFAVVKAVHGGVGGAYGGELNVPPEARSPAEFLSFLWQNYLPKLWFMQTKIGPPYGFRQLWIEQFIGGRFGALDTSFSAVTYDIVELAVLSLVVLVIATAIAHHELLTARWDVLVLLASMAISLVVFLHFASFRALSTGPGDPLIVGRYLLPLSSLVALSVAFVAAAWRRAGPYFAAVALGGALVLQLSAIGLTVARFHG